MATKFCSECKLEKSINDFHKDRTTKDGLSWRCKSCKKQLAHKVYKRDPEKAKAKKIKWMKDNPRKVKANKLKKYNMSIEEYEDLLIKQKNLCAICNQPETVKVNGITKLLAVDHNHKTGKSRRLLCDNCNKGLGCFKDNVLILKSAITYLEEYNL